LIKLQYSNIIINQTVAGGSMKYTGMFDLIAKGRVLEGPTTANMYKSQYHVAKNKPRPVVLFKFLDEKFNQVWYVTAYVDYALREDSGEFDFQGPILQLSLQGWSNPTEESKSECTGMFFDICDYVPGQGYVIKIVSENRPKNDAAWSEILPGQDFD
jgi:hypothetical protein